MKCKYCGHRIQKDVDGAWYHASFSRQTLSVQCLYESTAGFYCGCRKPEPEVSK